VRGLALVLFVVVGCTPNTEQHAHTIPKAEARMPVLSPQDRDFLERAAEGSNAEIAMGVLARTHALQPAVSAFGERMIADHTAINQRLAAIAKRHRTEPPTGLGDHQASFDRVVDLYRKPFDDEYMRVMVDDHNAAFELFRAQASGGNDPDLKAFAAQTLPAIAAHLEHAKTMAPPLTRQ
jgi:putative membrane protein